MTEQLSTAVILGLLAGVGLAGGAFYQHRGLRQARGDGDTLISGRDLWALLHNRTWLAGTALILLGAGLHLVGLRLAPVSVMQPLGVLAVPLTVLAASITRRRGPARTVYWGVVATVLGVAGFTVFSTTGMTDAVTVPVARLLALSAPFVAGAVSLGILAAVGPRRFRCLAWASAGAIGYGGSTALLKAAFVLHAGQGLGVSTLVVAGLAVIGLAGGSWAIQQGYATGQPEVVVGAMTTIDPVVAVLFGILVLGEGIRLDRLSGLAMAALALLAITGLLLLARHHPNASESDPLVPATRLATQLEPRMHVPAGDAHSSSNAHSNSR